MEKQLRVTEPSSLMADQRWPDLDDRLRGDQARLTWQCRQCYAIVVENQLARRGCAIVTGGESGIGRAIVLELARTHGTVAFTWHRSEQTAGQVADEVRALGASAVVSHLDLARVAHVPTVIAELLDRCGRPDVLVNNAAMAYSERLLDCRLEDVSTAMDVNFLGHVFVTQTVAKAMLSGPPGSVIVNVTSVLQDRAVAGSAIYASAKAALSALTRGAALEFAPWGIRVVAIAPGEIATAMNQQEGVDVSTVLRTHVPLGRPGDPREVARAIAFLVSEAASYITGTTLVCDGGLVLALPTDDDR